MPDQTILDTHFDESGAAGFLKCSPRTLQRQRNKRTGPPVTYIGKTPYYRKDSLTAWIESLEQKPTRRTRA